MRAGDERDDALPASLCQPGARANGPAAGTRPRGVARSIGRRPALSARTGSRACAIARFFLRRPDGALSRVAGRRRVSVRARADPRRRLRVAHAHPPRGAASGGRTTVVRRARSRALRRAPRSGRSARGIESLPRRRVGPGRGAAARARVGAGRARRGPGEGARTTSWRSTCCAVDCAANPARASRRSTRIGLRSVLQRCLPSVAGR